MNVDLNNISKGCFEKVEASSFAKAKEVLNMNLGEGSYHVLDVKSKRKWFIGPEKCEVSYLNLKGIKDSINSTKAQEASKPENNKDYVSREDVENMMEDVSDKMSMLMREMSLVLSKADRNSNDILTKVENVLVKNGVEREIAQEIIKDVLDSSPNKQKLSSSTNALLYGLKDYLIKLVKTNEGYDLNSVKKIMLVGPTGVGKTTTLAKLAYALYSQNKKVGMITLDTYRLGAEEQLVQYGEILDFPVEACKNIDELQCTLLEFMDKDCILIDTTGQNQKNIVIDENLRDMIDLINPQQLSLVVSATTKTEDLYDCIENFNVLEPNSLIVTKIDETNTLGEIINICFKYPKLKMVYFTNGQEVPADIEAAKSEKIIKSVIKLD